MMMKFEVANTDNTLNSPTVNQIRDGAKADLERAYEKIGALLGVMDPTQTENTTQHDVSIYAQLCVASKTVANALKSIPTLSMSSVCNGSRINRIEKPKTAPF